MIVAARSPKLLAAALAGFSVVITGEGVHADEGQWMPRQIPELDADALRRAGLRLPLSELQATDADGRQVGLLAATVNLGGCSAAFVSPDGLIATNHHCAYGALQAASSVEHDYLKDGFLATDRAGEIVAKNTSVQIVESVTDVTDRVRAVADAETDPAARAAAVEALRKTLVAECEAKPARRCRVADFYAGAEVQLIASIELEDVRLVYAPPTAIGNFGGEVDNWMWPRHTGDFSLLRVYAAPGGTPAEHAAANVPFRPQRHLEVGPGVDSGDFVAVMGFPGSTQRYQSKAEVARHIDQVFPARIDLYGEWIAILEAASGRDPAVRIKVAAQLKSLQNRHKNALGMLDGLRHNRTVERRQREAEQLRAWVLAHPEDDGGDALDAIEAVSTERRAEFDRDFLLESLGRGPNALAIAVDVVRRARERAKPDLERAPAYMDRNADDLWRTQTRRIRDYDPQVEVALIASVLRRIAAMPAAQRFVALGERDAQGLARTRLSDTAFVQGLWEADAATVERSRDPMIVLARTLATELEAHDQRVRTRDGVMLGAGPRYFELLRTVREGPVYPDANGTLRLSWGRVAGYSPREGIEATPRTTVSGLMAKHTGTGPFDVPERVREAAVHSSSSRWVDAALGDVPVAFLANLDTTGGNSGSPVVDGDGRWVGLNFDRVWENVAGDFGYSPERSRNVVVDVRYLLWQLDAVEHATSLLDELGIVAAPPADDPSGAHEAAASPSEDPAEIGVPARPAAPTTATSEGSGCGCASGTSTGDAPRGQVAGWFVLALGLRRRTARRRSR